MFVCVVLEKILLPIFQILPLDLEVPNKLHFCNLIVTIFSNLFSLPDLWITIKLKYIHQNQMIFCGSTISCCEFPPKKWSTIFRFPRQVETRGCPRIDACERIDPRGHPRRPSWTPSWIHVELDPIEFDGSNVDPARRPAEMATNCAVRVRQR